jgi:hypothetical protein
MPDPKTIERARADRRAGKAPTTQAGEFVREEVHHIREGEHGARSTQQAIAIGLSKARRAGVALRPPPKGKASAKTREGARRAYAKGRTGSRAEPSRTRAKATRGAVAREGRAAASRGSLARQARGAASRGTAGEREAAARKGARTKRPAVRRAAARKAARTRQRRG